MCYRGCVTARECPNCRKPIVKWRKSCSVDCANALRRKVKPDVPCARPGCNRPASKLRDSEYCTLQCYNASRRDAKAALTPPACPPGLRPVPLSQGQWALVDDGDYALVSAHNWVAVNVAGKGARPIYYARRSDGVYMHAFILGIDGDPSLESLHGPGGTLDNSRKNLRAGTRADNQRDRSSAGSTSRYKGVSWNFAARKWTSKVSAGDIYRFLGYFDDEVDAASAYDDAAREFHGEFARLNFPFDGEQSAVPAPVDRVCVQCDSSFKGPPGLDYCGQTCLTEASLPMRQCLRCRRPVPGYGKFCADACRDEFERTCWDSGPPASVPGASWIKLTLGKWALVDDADLPVVLGPAGDRKWFAKEGRGNWYAARNAMPGEHHTFGRVVSMHRLLMNLSRDDERMVDHADRDGLNNRRSNLTLTDNSGNQMNTASRGTCPFKGVIPVRNGYFMAKIFARGRHEYLGRFRSAEDAARAYDERARVVHGANGRYNFPEPGERSAR